jgi:hypothetical protein
MVILYSSRFGSRQPFSRGFNKLSPRENGWRPVFDGLKLAQKKSGGLAPSPLSWFQSAFWSYPGITDPAAWNGAVLIKK